MHGLLSDAVEVQLSAAQKNTDVHGLIVDGWEQGDHVKLPFDYCLVFSVIPPVGQTVMQAGLYTNTFLCPPISCIESLMAQYPALDSLFTQSILVPCADKRKRKTVMKEELAQIHAMLQDSNTTREQAQKLRRYLRFQITPHS